ncbi:MAG: TldD/PmbA family protein [Dehalococcoidia bacterium]|nr:MAG: TldD/PmbA family protein [Dehalococcoidia bacterium]
MQDLIQKILDKAKKTAQSAEVFMFISEETPVVFEANRLKSLQSKESTSISLRIFKDGRVGFASSNKPEDVDGLMQAAIETAQFGAPANFNLPGLVEFPIVEVYDPAVERVSLEKMVDLGEEMVSALTTHTPEILCEAAVTRNKISISIANSSGLEAAYTKSAFAIGIEGTVIHGSDMLFVGESESSCHPVLDTTNILNTVRRQLAWARTQSSVSTGKLPVIFTPDGVASALIAPLMAAFNGKIALEGASPLGNKIDQKIFDRKLNLYDDATIAFQPGSRPFDDEGIPSRKLPLIEAGTPRNFLYDLKTAALAHTESTGHGGRGGGLPSPAPGAFVFNNGDVSPDSMIADIKEGLFIEHVMGATQGNILGGDFSGNVLLGYKIENGRIAGRVKDTMVFGNVYELLKDIAAIGNDGRWLGGRFFTPSIYCPSLSVSSK